MSRNFNLNLNLGGLKWNDPRVAVRVVLGILLLANLVTAVIAFKPFGGSADDLRRERNNLQQQLAQLQKTVADSKNQVEKVKIARTQGDEFLAKYFTDRRVLTSTIQGELEDIAKQAGVIYQPTTWTPEPIDGSDTLAMMTINAGCQGTYAALSKFVNLVDRSPRFLILESMAATPQQTGQTLNVTLKIDTFIHDSGGAGGEMGAPAGPVAMPVGDSGGGL